MVCSWGEKAKMAAVTHRHFLLAARSRRHLISTAQWHRTLYWFVLTLLHRKKTSVNCSCIISRTVTSTLMTNRCTMMRRHSNQYTATLTGRLCLWSRLVYTALSPAQCIQVRICMVWLPCQLPTCSNCPAMIAICHIVVLSSSRRASRHCAQRLAHRKHINNVTKNCFLQLHHIKWLGCCVDHYTAIQLVWYCPGSTTVSCNIILYGLSESTIATLQHIHNTAAWLILGLRWHDIIQALKELHWLMLTFFMDWAA